MENKSYTERVPEIEAEINKRKSKWNFVLIEWEDAAQIIRIRVYNKYHTYDPEKGAFSPWVNRLITRCIANIRRDNYTKFARPCVAGTGRPACKHNLGGEDCAMTQSGKQCSECPLYKVWCSKKQNHYNIKSPLALENHTQEVESIQADFIDIAGAKQSIDLHIRAKLKPLEYKIYKMLYIDGMTDEQVASALGYKPLERNGRNRYKQLQNIKKNIIAKAKEVIDEEDLV